MNVRLTNPIIFTPVQLTILIMAENVPAVLVPPPPARNSVDQALAWIGFGTKGNRNNIRDVCRMEAFDDFVGLNMSNIRDMTSGLSKRTTTQGRTNLGMRHVNYTRVIMNCSQDESRCSHTASLTWIDDAK